MPVLPPGTGEGETERDALEDVTPVDGPFRHPIPRIGEPRELHPGREQDIPFSPRPPPLDQGAPAGAHGPPLQKEEVAAGGRQCRHIPSHPCHHTRRPLVGHGQVAIPRPRSVLPHDYELVGVQVIDPLDHSWRDSTRHEDNRQRGHVTPESGSPPNWSWSSRFPARS